MLVKKLRIIFLSLLIFSLFVSCENSISYDDEEIQSSITSEEVNTPAPVKYASINGFYQNYGGALPAGIQKAIAEINTARPDIKNRSAYPGLNTTLNEIQYYVTATAENEAPVSGSVSVENKSYSVSGLKFGIDWTVEVGIKVKQTGEGETENWARCFYDVSEPVRITESNMAVSRNLILKPDTSGYGSVELNLTTDSSINDLEIKLDNEEQRSKWQTALEADSEKEISASKIKLANLPSGQYDLTLLFKRSDESYPCYSTTQTIIVINGMTTDTWQSNGTSLISTTGEFNLTSAIISNYVDSCIYVGPNSASRSIGVTPDNSNEGRAYSPLESVNEAIKRIKNANVRRNYKIFVSGECAENIKIGGEGADVLPGTAASSITIQGLNNNNATDVLMSPYLSTAPCLSIQTDIPVIFKNIKITTNSNSLFGAYNTSAQGGGLYIKTGADAPGVTLDSGALIDGCIISGTEAKGAGIYLDSGKLTIKNDAKISNNHFPDSNGFGGGIYIKSGAELILSGSFDIPYGGSVTQNDIYVEAADSIKIKNAISPQAGTTSGVMATITSAQDLQRGVSIVSLASGSSLSSIVHYKDYFALSNDDWLLKANGAGNALVLDAPIYVAGSANTLQFCSATGSDTGNGTKSAPFATIEQAVNAIIGLNAAEDYTIYVDGEIIGLQSIPSSLTSSHASGITIKGASGNTNDILNGNSEGSVLTISSPVPVTIKDLKIIGGNNTDNGGGINMMSGSNVTLESGALIGGTSGSTAASVTDNSNKAAKGGGIYSEGNLTLKNGSSVTYNYAGEMGGGIYCGGGSLSINDCAAISLNGAYTSGGGVYTTNNVTVSGPVIITGNVNNSGNPSNLYLEGQKKVILMGSLTNGEENAQIGISNGAQLNPGDSIVFTSNYGLFNSGAPGTYFTGDRWTVAAGSGTSAGEAVLTTSGGGISIAPIYENISISIDKTIIAGTAASKVFNFTATGEDADANGEPDKITAGTGEGKISYTYTVSYHGETVPQDDNNTYYTPGTSSITFKNSMPAGSYFITVQGTYNGRTYGADFNVNICDKINAENLTEELYEIFTEINLSSAAGMNTISQLCSSGKTFADKTVSLNDNITLDSNYTAISDFRGVFDGHNHTISGLNNQSALFDKLNGGGTIKRLTVAGTSTQAGIVRILSNGTVEDCVSEVNITQAGNDNVGGIASEIGSYGTIRNCVNKGTIISSASGITGGILGYAWATTTCIIENCINKGNISARVWSGGIVGYFVPNSSSYIRNCKNTGTITCANSNRGYGGIVGYTSSKRINNCCNTGTITGAEGVTENKGTGIIACFTGNPHLENNCNIGSVTFGILGPATNDATGFSPSNNYSLSTAASGGAWSTIKEGSNDLEFFSSMTDDMIKSFNTTETDVDTVVAALNSWVTSNGSSVYASWIKNAEGKPELNLGDLENR